MYFLLFLTSSPSVPYLISPDSLREAQQQVQTFGIPIWIWFLLIALVIVVAVIWTLYEERESGTQDEAIIQAVTEPLQVAAAEPAATPEVRPDNLKRISGIGPKIERLLKSNGIMTFAQLAEADINRLQALLDEFEYTLADPTTWPEQARKLI